MNSIRGQVMVKDRLSPGQNSWLSSLEKKYSEESIEKNKIWESLWSDSHRKTAIRVAHYYKRNPPYFENVVNNILYNQEKFVLSESIWNKFCENKFAKRILSEYERPCRFKKGDCVQIRKNNRLDLANYDDETGKIGPSYIAYSEKVGFVVATNSKPITRAAKGSKIYKILMVGEVSPIYAHESDLKNKRGKKT